MKNNVYWKRIYLWKSMIGALVAGLCDLGKVCVREMTSLGVKINHIHQTQILIKIITHIK